MKVPQNIFSYPKYRAQAHSRSPFLPMSKEEMDALGWDSCDIIIVTGDAYVDHPSFGMAVIGRFLESQGFRVGIIAQPDWTNKNDFMKLGRPNLFFGVTGGNMDSMVNRYTADRKIRSDDAYTPGGMGGKRPDRCVIIYSHRCREAFPGTTVIIGGIEASLRRIAHYDYWSDKVRHSILVDSKADLLVYGNGERQIIEIAHRLAKGESIKTIRDIRGTAFITHITPEGWLEIDSTQIDTPGAIDPKPDPYAWTNKNMPLNKRTPCASKASAVNDKASVEVPVINNETPVEIPSKNDKIKKQDWHRTFIRMPSYEQVAADAVLYAHASRILHIESNPGNARALVQRHGKRDIWLNPPPIPLETPEMDGIFDLEYERVPHPDYGTEKIPAYEMIRFSVIITRGCFGGCTFCSITEHEGRIIQNRSQKSVIKEIEAIKEKVPGFTGVISDLGGPTANMYRLACKSKEIEAACRRPSCVYPAVCPNLNTDHTPLVNLYRKARAVPGVKKILIASGLRYDLAVESPIYIKELAKHHVGGYLKIAPEHTEDGPLSKMMKPGIGTFEKFKFLFDKYSREAGKKQYLIPYFIAAHPGTTDEDMLNLALWLKQYDFRPDQVQNFFPTPMATATAMYHSGKNPLRKVTYQSEEVESAKKLKIRQLHKAFLRYHDANNWPVLREALIRMGREDLIGNEKHHLVPNWQPKGTGQKKKRGKKSNGDWVHAKGLTATLSYKDKKRKK